MNDNRYPRGSDLMTNILDTLHGRQTLGDQFSAEGEPTIRANNPQTGEVLPGAFYEATEQEAGRALTLAAECADAFRLTPRQTRANLLRLIADRIEALGDALLQRAHEETALPMPRLTGERGRTVAQARRFADLIEEGSWVDARIDTARPDRQPLPKPDVRKMLRPIGPVVVFGASNFPLAISVAGSDTVSALGAGCPVVVKAHPGHPGACELIAGAVREAVAEAGLPAGVFSLVHGASHDVGRWLVEHPACRAVAFTGSLAGGKALADLAAARPEPIPVYAEMGSVNPMFLMPRALAERAEQIAEQYVLSLNMGVGQFCTNPGVVLAVEGPGYDAFKDAVAQRVTGTAPATMLHAGICSAYGRGVERLQSNAQVQPVASSEQAADADKAQAACQFFETDAQSFLNNPALQDEVFGPCGLLVRCKDAGDFERIAAAMAGSLTATVHAQPGEVGTDSTLVATLEPRVGRLLFNGIPTGIEVCASMHHGGPFPATTHAGYTSIGTDSILRFVKPVCYQGWPDELLPEELRNANPAGIWRMVDDQRTQEPVRPNPR